MAGVAWFCAFASLALAMSAGARANTAASQQQPRPQEPRPKVRLVTATQGRAIVDNALNFEQPIRGTQDCSHLVHEIYAAAGFEYPYASSFDLYAGHDNFRRVKAPQPGDLVAWPGHVGIVLDPAEHTFYSLVRSGLQAENYTGRYWKARGHARFYRYVAHGAGNAETATGPAVSPRRVPRTIEGDDASIADSHQATGDREAPLPVKTASGRTVVGPPPPPLLPPPADVPTSVLVVAEQRRPTPEEVSESISELSNASGNILRTPEPLKFKVPVVIFDRLSVERLEIKNDHGWAHLAVDSNVLIGEDGADFKRRREKVRWELRRTDAGWVALAPSERAYVPRDVAVRVLAAQLAHLTETNATSERDEVVLGQEGRIANLLSALLQTK